jgi:Fe-S cluster assembly protein SufD
MGTTLLDWAENQKNPILKESSWLLDYRAKAEASFKKTGLPHQKMESWKYINVRSIFEKEYIFDNSTESDLDHFLKEVDQTQQRLVFVEGILKEDLSLVREKNEIHISSLDSLTCEKTQKKVLQSLETESNPLAFLNASRFEKAYVVQFVKESELKEPLHVYYLSSLKTTASFIKTCFIFEQNSKVKIVTHFVGVENQESLVNEFCEIYLERNAKVDWVNIQKLNSGNKLFSAFRASLDEWSELKRLSFSNQGDIIRNDESIRMLGKESYCILKGLAFLRGQSQVFNEVSVHHHAGNCRSEQIYKNILADSSKAEFNSLAYVYRNAQKSDSMQLNKNLLLSDDARVYSRPKLMIYADDVVANHGSANGQLDKKELFYLLSRGFSKKLARYVLTLGFAKDILESIQIDSLRLELEDLVRSKLEEMSN